MIPLTADVHPTLAVIGWVLLHFIWQGVLIGLVFAVVMSLLAQRSAATRYAVSLGFLGLLASCPVVTFAVLWQAPVVAARTVTPVEALALAAHPTIAGDPWDPFVNLLAWFAPWTVPAWGLGVLLLTARVACDWRKVQRLVRGAGVPENSHWGRVVDELAARLAIRRRIRLLESALVQVPIVVGWLRPVVVVPTSVLLGLEPRQLELILIHELAHVRRYDYLVNLAQIAIETLLFYHPVVRFVSERVRQERENCCDDLVLVVSQERLTYARALIELEGLRSLAHTAALSSAGGLLLGRIRRIVGAPAPQRGSAHWLVASALIGIGAGGTGVVQLAEDHDRDASSVTDPVDFVHPSPRPLVMEPAGQTDRSASDREVERASENSSRESRREVQRAADADTPAPAAERRPTTAGTGGSGPDLTRGESGSAPSSLTLPAPADPTVDAASPATSAAATDAALRRAEQNPAELAPEPLPASKSAQADTLAGTSPSAEPGEAGRGPAVEPAMLAPATSQPQTPVVTGGAALEQEPPEFPRDAVCSGTEGYVVVRYTIDKTGRTRDIDILEAEPRRAFSRAARKAVSRWRFEPTLVDGVAVARTLEQRFTFDLPESDGSTPSRLNCTVTGTRLRR